MFIIDSLSQIDYWLLGALALVMLYQCYFYCRYMMGCNRWLRRNSKKTINSTSEEYPGVSVIVCARNEENNLRNYLQALLTQDYPCYEVIVVNDGSEDDTQMVLEQYMRQYKHLYVTFVPREARIISSKKLALTIGAKAAHYDYLLLTDADCRPESRYWIRDMARGFCGNDGKTEVVLGYGAYFSQKSLLNSLINYDTLFIGLQYMGMAVAGKAYMGVGRNLAYKRETFFNHSGFRGLLGERAGDDDLFVNKIVTRENTQIVCTPDSITWSVPKASWREWFHQKRRHLSVSPHYKTASKIQLTIEPLTRGLFYALLIAIFVFGSGWAMVGAYALWCVRLILQLCVINTSSRRLGGQLFGIEIVLYEIVLPLVSAYLLATHPWYKKRMHW